MPVLDPAHDRVDELVAELALVADHADCDARDLALQIIVKARNTMTADDALFAAIYRLGCLSGLHGASPATASENRQISETLERLIVEIDNLREWHEALEHSSGSQLGASGGSCTPRGPALVCLAVVGAAHPARRSL